MSKQPSFTEVAAAMKMLQPEDKGLSKHITTIIVAAAIGIGAWTMNGINSMQQSVVQMATTIGEMQKTVDRLATKADNDQKESNATATSLARIEQRVQQIEQRLAMDPRRGAYGEETYRREEGSGMGGPSPRF